MLKVKIINGNYGHNDNGKIITIPLNGEVELHADEARRIIELGVAELVTDHTDDNRGTVRVATGENNTENTTPSVNPSENESGAEGKTESDMGEELALDETQLRSMTNADLKKLAEDMGINTSKMKVKNDFVDAIMAETINVDSDNEFPPVATVENPIG